MNSKIRVELDFDTKEPYLQIFHEMTNGDLADKTLKHFIELASDRGMKVWYNYADNGTPQIRLSEEPIDIDAKNNGLSDSSLIKAFEEMCEESLDPEQFEKFEAVKLALQKVRNK